MFGGPEQLAQRRDRAAEPALRRVTNRMARTDAERRSRTTTAQRLGSLIKSARDIMRKDKGLNGDLDRLPLLTWIMFLKFLDDLEQSREDEAQARPARSSGPPSSRPTAGATGRRTADGITGDELIAFINQDEAVRPDGKQGPGPVRLPARPARAPTATTGAT